MVAFLTMLYSIIVLGAVDLILYILYWPKYASKFGFVSYFPGVGFYVTYKANKDEDDDRSWWDL